MPENLEKYKELYNKLVMLINSKQGESTEADSIRDDMDLNWNRMTVGEKNEFSIWVKN